MLPVVLATHNAKKLTELRRIVADAAPQVQILGLDELPSYPEPAETESTFEGNALIKARAAVAATGCAALADDSGLVVDILNGMPGVRSARWAGPKAGDQANNDLLLAQLLDVPDHQRTARFVCAMALVIPGGIGFVRRGEMPGRIAKTAMGEYGFGYDPLFVADDQSVTNGELLPAAKDAISHRGLAIRAIVAVLVDQLARATTLIPSRDEKDE